MDKWLHHPTAVKLVALALGIIMWAVVHYEPPDSRTTDTSSLTETKKIESVKVQAYGLDERNYKLVSLEPQTVTVTVRGTRSDFLLANTEDYKVLVDLREVVPGRNTMPLQAELPRGVTLVANGISPGTLEVQVEQLLTKEFEVGVTVEGTPAEGFKSGTPIVKPSNRVHVTLPENEMGTVERVGGVISVEGEKATLKDKSVKLVVYDKAGNAIENALIEPAILEVEVPITHPFKTVPLQIRLSGKMPTGLSILTFKPDVEQVTVYGPQADLDKLEFLETTVELDSLQNSGKVPVVLKATAPIIEITPKQFDISVEVVLSGTRNLEGLAIEFNDLGEGLSVQPTAPSTGRADITIQGAPSNLDRLQPGDVDVIADLAGKGPGTYTVPLIVNLPRFVEQAGGTSSITLEITSDEPAMLPEDGEATEPEQ